MALSMGGLIAHLSIHAAVWSYLRLELLVVELAFRIWSGSICQFFMVPLTSPEMTMNSKTRTLMQVKTLLTIADSLTPNASRPERKVSL